METTAVKSGAATRPRVYHLTNISSKNNERIRTTVIPDDIVVPKRKPRVKKEKVVQPFVARKRSEHEAGSRDYNTLDKPPYVTGDGDVSYALRPGAMDFMKYNSFGNRT